MKSAFDKVEVKYQLVPPHTHRWNTVECAIRTLKNYLITGLCMCDTRYSAREWDRLIKQFQLTLNLLRSLRRHPSMSIYASVWRNFSFNTKSLAPPGTIVWIHNKPQKRGTWGVHGTDAWYIGPSMNYKFYNFYVLATGGTIIVDKVDFSRNKYIFQ